MSAAGWRAATLWLLAACDPHAPVAAAAGSGPSGLMWPPDSPEALNRTCELCHPEEATQWRASLHRDAFTNPAFARSFAREPTPFCQGCHAPHADPTRPPPRWAADNGVTCVACHLAGGAVRAASTPRSAEPAPHPLARSAGFSGPQACAGCHEFAFPPARRRQPGAVMQSTLHEHARSEYADIACQSCHMGAGPGARRDHRFAVSQDPALLRAAISASARRLAPDLLQLDLAPVGVGHAFPTGDLFRRLALVVEALDAADVRVAGATRYLARHFPARVHRGPGPQPPDPPELDDRLTEATHVQIHVPGAEAGHTLRWRVVYQRVDQRDAFAPELSSLAGEVELAGATLAAWPGEPAMPGP